MKIKKIVFSWLIMIIMVVLVASCTPTAKVTSIEVDETTIPSAVVVGDFELSTIFLYVNKSDGTKKHMQVTLSMVKPDEFNKLSIVGSQTIKINYQGHTCDLTVTINPPTDSIINNRLLADRDNLIVATEVASNFTLPLKGLNGSFISWTSDNETIKINSNTGEVVITRPLFEQGDLQVTLYATLEYYGVQMSQDIDIVVLALPQDNLESEIELLATNIVLPSTITDSLSLPFNNQEYIDLVIKWTSNNPSVIAINNQTKTVQVIKPNQDTEVTLSLEITYRGRTFNNFQVKKITVLGSQVSPQAPKATNLQIVSNILSWQKVSGALSYKVYIGGALKATVNTNAIDLTTIVDTKGTYIIGVQTVAFDEHVEDSEIAIINYTLSSYEGSYYNTVNLNLVGSALKIELRALLTSTQTRNTTYENLKTDLQYTDADLTTNGNIILFYSRISIKSTWDGGTKWNREHVWPQSLGWFTTSGAGADLHHIRPTDSVVNSTRGNLKFGEVTNGKQIKLGAANGGAFIDCYIGGGYFEPTDEVKGDIARILFFLYTRYSQSDSYSFTTVAQNLDMLLRWHSLDPVDENELIRNNRIAERQGNRNPFIDYPGLVNRIWQ